MIRMLIFVYSVFILMAAYVNSTFNMPLMVEEVKSITPSRLSENSDKCIIPENYELTNDSICIYENNTAKAWFYEYELNQIEDLLPGLAQFPPFHPDSIYSKSTKIIHIHGIDGACKTIDFENEAGHDDFLLIYSYYLKLKNNGSQMAKIRKHLGKIYELVQSVLCELNGGGSGFGHLFLRIPAYIEYDVYQYENPVENNPNNFKLEKDSLFKQLETRMLSDLDNNVFYPIQQRSSLRNSISKKLKALSALLINFFYYSKGVQFIQSNYKSDTDIK